MAASSNPGDSLFYISHQTIISKRHICLLEVISGCNVSSFCATIFVLNVQYNLYIFVYLFSISVVYYSVSLGFMDKYERVTK